MERRSAKKCIDHLMNVFFNIRYGSEVGTVTENALTSVGNTYLTVYNASTLGPKSLAKRAAKTTGKVAVGVSEDVILGRTVAPALIEEEDHAKADSGSTHSNQEAIEHKPDQISKTAD